jgi:hypothetical protein
MMRPAVTRLAGVPLLVAAGAAAPPATAAPVTVPNTCFHSFDGRWHDQPGVVDLAAGPDPVAPGGPFTTRGSLTLELPARFTRLGYTLGLLKAGENRVAARASLALAATGATPASQVVETDVAFVTTIETNGPAFTSGDPLTVTIPLPSGPWTAPADGAVALRQAGPGLLPKSAAGAGPRGSVFVEGKLGFFAFSMDCQPGTSKPGGAGPIPQEAAPALALGVGRPAAPPPPPPAATAPDVAVLSRGLRVRGGAVRLAVRCVATTPCAGVATLRSAARLRLGARRARVALGATTFSLRPGRAATLVIRPAPRALARLAGRDALAVRATAAPRSGAPASRLLVLRLH